MYKDKNREKEYQKEWRIRKNRTLLGRLKNMYKGMKTRTKKHNFKKLIKRENFIKWALNDYNYIHIFEIWKINNYDHLLTPSIDRIDCERGYVKGNMQFLTTSDNCSKNDKEHYDNRYKNCQKKVKLINLIDNSELIFESETKACQFFGVMKGTLSVSIKTTNRYKSYLVYFIDENNNIINFKPPDIKKRKIVKLIRGNEEHICFSLGEATAFIGIDRNVLSYRGKYKTSYGYYFVSTYKSSISKSGWHIIFLDKFDEFYSLYPELKRKEAR